METALYIHFPFCVRKCPYCDFNSRADSAIPQDRYIDTLLREMEMRREGLPGELSAPSLYLGGGTPSLIKPFLAERIITGTRRIFSLRANAEITMEVNPGTVTPSVMSGFISAGVNRISLGIQSFSDGMLSLLGRIHSARDGIEAFEAARMAGFDNIGIDLIHSLPGQTREMWLAELQKGVSLRPEHISAYGLAIEPGTPFHAMETSGQLRLPSEDEAAEMFEQTSSFLRAAGYEHYEISNFALPGFRSSHNQVYWQRGNYLGFGAGAHSFLRSPLFGRRWKNPDLVESYMEIVAGGTLPEKEGMELSKPDAIGERIFLGMRMLEGIDGEQFHREFGLTLEEAFPGQLQALINEGMMEWEGFSLRLSRKGLILSNQVFARLI